MVIRLVLAEDSYLVREGIRTLLELQDDLELVGVAEDLDSLLACVDAQRPDVVLTDIRMPPTGTDEGVRAAERLRESHPDTGVIVLSQYLEPDYALALFDQGAQRRGYLLKERVYEVDQLSRAIHDVARGGSVIDTQVVEALVSARTATPSLLTRLTPRELETLSLMATGMSNHAIAESMVLSERAVEKHINAVFSKLDLTLEPDVHRRVKAVLVFLTAEGS
ncbi:MAG: response regulator transcription factor [Actinomycetota bacterium]|nr:response regulator transcription factor [Actinomycetota bacterium]